jgi:hypothetical protein
MFAFDSINLSPSNRLENQGHNVVRLESDCYPIGNHPILNLLSNNQSLETLQMISIPLVDSERHHEFNDSKYLADSNDIR